MARIKAWMASNKAAARVLLGVLVVVVATVAYVGVSAATDKPAFCGSACHEMSPYHTAWAEGPHKDVSCVDCHVDAGQVAHFRHKFVALKEVVSHFAGRTSLPLTEPAKVPNERCIRCHEDVQVTQTGFDHAVHVKRGECAICHAEVGHVVTNEALKQAGIFNPTTAAARATTQSNRLAAVNGGKANLAGHVAVPCSRCHNMAKTACSVCHTPKHVARGECTTCHATGDRFAFVHPRNRPDCGACHKKLPATHKHQGVCGTCHTSPGVSWKYAHTSTSTACVSCHAAPAKHRPGACASCHKHPGVSWAFSHPAAKSTCTSCHTRPAKHRAGACSSCHRKAGVSWAFTHPGSASSCAACHTRPAGHKSGSCNACHRKVGVSWAFTHTTSSRCASCHSAPSNHFGTGCASCHRPARAWRSAVFRHGSIPGGQHSYRSFACSNCHPRGYSSHTCAKCHDSSGGPRGD